MAILLLVYASKKTASGQGETGPDTDFRNPSFSAGKMIISVSY
jgi:hypothetical protein